MSLSLTLSNSNHTHTHIQTHTHTGFKPATLADLGEVLPADVKVDTSEMAYITTHTAKGMGMAQASNEVVGSVISTMSANIVPSVLVSSEDAPAGRLSMPSLYQSDSKTVAISGFSKGTPVALALTTKCSPVPGAGQEEVSLGQFSPKTRGASSVPFTMPEDTEDGVYSVKATQNGFTFCSQPFDYKSGDRR